MESEGVSLPLMHEHPMLPWNNLRKGDCCGCFEDISDGYICKPCDFFVHKKCSDLSLQSIRHPLHSIHTLQLRRNPGSIRCDVCRKRIVDLFYHCDECDFDIDLFCAKYPPPEVIDISETHHHKLTLFKELIKEFYCDATCGKRGRDEFAYKCHECDVAFHVDCVLHRSDSEGVLLPLIHKHPMLPWNSMRKGDCCGRSKAISDGYFCKRCNFFFHKNCSDHAPQSIRHPLHLLHNLQLRSKPDSSPCNVCEKLIVDLFYRCDECDFNIDLFCAKYPPTEVNDISEMHHHKFTLVLERKFHWDADFGRTSEDVWFPSQVNTSIHSLHPLQFTGEIPDYSNGTCRLCELEIDGTSFYHCSYCNFTLHPDCVFNPPQRSLLDLKAHDHQLTLLLRLNSFTCNACRLKGDRSPYVCFQCGFTIHQDCLHLPRLININRHDHRVSRISVLGVVNSVCGVCRKKVDWSYGGYSCVRCASYVVHSKCATRKDVWNGKELEGVPEEDEDVTPYVVIDDNTIQHFSHKEHHLRLHVNGVLYEERKRCRACTHPISLHSFYSCIDCDFILHDYCAKLPTKKWHVLHNERLTLVTRDASIFECSACYRISSGFRYEDGDKQLDVMCGSISDPLLHRSHPDHPLFYILSDERKVCNGCQEWGHDMRRCIENSCEFFVCFKCATLPQVVKHRVDDHPLSLRYGEKATGICWCDICERKMDPEKWFYTCKDFHATLHVECVFGDLFGLMPGGTINAVEVVLNNSIYRPFCKVCKSHCMYPIMMKIGERSDTYFCSFRCSKEGMRLMSEYF